MSDQQTSSIKLDRPIISHEGAISEIVLRDPLYPDFMAIGEPWSFVYDAKGVGVPVDSEPAVAEYIRRCLVTPKDELLLQQCTIGDARRLKKWLLGFFTSDVAASAGSTTS